MPESEIPNTIHGKMTPWTNSVNRRNFNGYAYGSSLLVHHQHRSSITSKMLSSSLFVTFATIHIIGFTLERIVPVESLAHSGSMKFEVEYAGIVRQPSVHTALMNVQFEGMHCRGLSTNPHLMPTQIRFRRKQRVNQSTCPASGRVILGIFNIVQRSVKFVFRSGSSPYTSVGTWAMCSVKLVSQGIGTPCTRGTSRN